MGNAWQLAKGRKRMRYSTEVLRESTDLMCESISLDILKKENERLIKLLNDKYPYHKLFNSCGIVSLALICSIIGWEYFNLQLINPVISIPCLIGTLGFTILSLLRRE